MEQKEFKLRLEASTKKLLEFTQAMVTNEISEDVVYLIEPNRREASPHLNVNELKKLKKLNRIEGKLFNSSEVASLLYDSQKVPLWINGEVHRSSSKKTIVILICSRRYRHEKELNYKVDKYPPFHLLVPLPPWHKENEKFNVNWKFQVLKRKWHALIWKWKNRKETKARLKR